MQKSRVFRHEVVQPQDQSIRIIPLTKDQNAIVDASDYEWLMQWNWCASWSETTQSFYAKTYDRNTKKLFYMHRILVQGYAEVDHQNHQTLDNRRGNLRGCTSAKNKVNCGIKSTNTSGYKGVSWSKQRKKWIASIQIEGKVFNLGGYENKEDAHHVYCDRAKSTHGEFAH